MRRKRKRVKVKKTVNPIQRFVQISIAAFFGVVVLPYSFSHVTKPLFINPINTKNITVDYNQIINPTVNYMHNEYFMNQNMRIGANVERPMMQPLFEAGRMTMLETRLHQLMLNYPTIQPSIYVWEYEQGKFANINGDKIYPTASIIKLPILVEIEI